MDNSKACCTEEHIRMAAKKLFFVDGKLNATTQEIADAAGVNRTLLNYYFRSRDELFRQVYREARMEIETILDNLFTSKLEFRAKIEHIIDEFGSYVLNAPYSELFLISEINNLENPISLETKASTEPMKGFLKEIQTEMDKGSVHATEPVNFVINLFSLVSHPILLKPLYYRIFDIDENEFNRLFEQRKNMILNLLFTSTK